MLTRILIFSLVINFNIHSYEGNFFSKITAFFNKQPDSKNLSLPNLLNNFDDEFTFISSHYRTDQNTIRLIYANKLALKGLNSKQHEYENGSIFYKVVYKVNEDPLFNASLVPESIASARQIMIRDKENFKEYGGWNYGLYDNIGNDLWTGGANDAKATCYTCHTLAESRNSIFSTKMETILPNKNFSQGGIFTNKELIKSKIFSNQIFSFKLVNRKSLPNDIESNLKQSSKEVNLFSGSILVKEFTGIFYEINSFLVKETLKNKLPSVAFKEIANQFGYSYAFIEPNYKKCKVDELLLVSGWGVIVGGNNDKNDFRVHHGGNQRSGMHSKCYPKLPMKNNSQKAIDI